jgi:D-aminopeptidase
VLKLGMAKSPQGGPLEPASDGRLVSPAGGIGEIVLEPKGDKLVVQFGGESADYRKLVEDAADADAFAMAAAGAYRSHDAGGTASIEQQDDKLMLRVSNDYGAVRSVLTALGPTLAVAKPKSVGGFQATIGLILKDGKPVGFRLDTPRTRNLEFQKV